MDVSHVIFSFTAVSDADLSHSIPYFFCRPSAFPIRRGMQFKTCLSIAVTSSGNHRVHLLWSVQPNSFVFFFVIFFHNEHYYNQVNLPLFSK